MLENHEVTAILDQFGLSFREVTALYDTSHGEKDQRLNYILDDKYVLKVHSPNSVWEERLQEIGRLIERYRAIGVYCPRMIPTRAGTFSCTWNRIGGEYTCFVEEYADYPACRDDTVPPRSEVVRHLGVLARNYTGIDLSDNYSMWSIIDLCPLDAELGYDEKQDNTNDLVRTLQEVGRSDLAQKVDAFNRDLRDVIREDYKTLPRCVYQGDLNPGNELHDHGRFAGLIDFNLSGTDVNINVFLNETNRYLNRDDFDAMTIPELIRKMEVEQQELLDIIFESYRLNDLEERLFPYYRRIVALFQHPNVCAMCEWLKDGTRRSKTAELIQAWIEKPLEGEAYHADFRDCTTGYSHG